MPFKPLVFLLFGGASDRQKQPQHPHPLADQSRAIQHSVTLRSLAQALSPDDDDQARGWPAYYPSPAFAASLFFFRS